MLDQLQCPWLFSGVLLVVFSSLLGTVHVYNDITVSQELQDVVHKCQDVVFGWVV